MKTGDDGYEELIKRNHHYPYFTSKFFGTTTDNQKSVEISVYSSAVPITKASQGILVGQFRLTNLPKGTANRDNINVKFAIDEDGLLRVTATERESGKEATIIIVNDQGLSSHGNSAQVIKSSFVRFKLFTDAFSEIVQRSHITLPQHQSAILTSAKELIRTSESNVFLHTQEEYETLHNKLSTFADAMEVSTKDLIYSSFSAAWAKYPVAATSHVYQPKYSKVDYALMMDATGSMSNAIIGTKNYIVQSTSKMKLLSYSQSEFNAACVCYRDPIDSPGDKNESIDFTNNIEQIEAWLDTQKASGGGDEPEDWAGAFEIVRSLKWREDSLKTLVILADAPGHGLGSYHGNHHSSQEPLVKAEIEKIAKMDIRLAILIINNGSSPLEHITSCADQVEKIYRNAGGKMCIIDKLNLTTYTSASDEELQKLIADQLEVTSIQLFTTN